MVPESSQKEERVCQHNTERLKFGTKVLTLHFKAQQMHMTTSFKITGKQPLVTTLLYYKLILHFIHIKSTLH